MIHVPEPRIIESEVYHLYNKKRKFVLEEEELETKEDVFVRSFTLTREEFQATIQRSWFMSLYYNTVNFFTNTWNIIMMLSGVGVLFDGLLTFGCFI